MLAWGGHLHPLHGFTPLQDLTLFDAMCNIPPPPPPTNNKIITCSIKKGPVHYFCMKMKVCWLHVCSVSLGMFHVICPSAAWWRPSECSRPLRLLLDYSLPKLNTGVCKGKEEKQGYGGGWGNVTVFLTFIGSSMDDSIPLNTHTHTHSQGPPHTFPCID